MRIKKKPKEFIKHLTGLDVQDKAVITQGDNKYSLFYIMEEYVKFEKSRKKSGMT